MGTRVAGAETVYAAAAAWVDRGLRRDDSLFTPGVAIWADRWLEELHKGFLERPDESAGRSFLDKLERQLDGAPREAYQLMAEVLYVHLLIVHTTDSARERKLLESVLGWSQQPVSIPPERAAGLVPGIADPGQAFHSYRPYQVGLIIEFVGQWKQLQPDDREHLLQNPWAFKDFLMGLKLGSALLRERQNRPRIQRHALLHLVHPDTFESVVSEDHKVKIATAFEGLLDDPPKDVDRKLQMIRPVLEGRHGGETFHFYRPDIRELWDGAYAPDLWDTFVESAREYVDKGQLDFEETDYKVKIGQRLAEASEAALVQSSSWPDLVKRGLNSNLIHRVSIAKFRDWIDDAPDEALGALQAIWADGDRSASERVRAFSGLLPTSTNSGVGVRTTIASVLLMGLDAERYPPFRTTLFEEAYERTGYKRPVPGADEASLYGHALGFLDRFIDEASARGLNLRHRLDAQSVVWAVINPGEPPGRSETPPEPEARGLAELARTLNVPTSFLDDARVQRVIAHYEAQTVEEAVAGNEAAFDDKSKTVVNKDMEDAEYDVGLSFAGEQRDYVRRVAEDLQYRGLRVFYDENEEDQLWGKNLLDYLSELYLKRCRYCIIFASAEYAAKMWPNLERQSAQARDITGAGGYIFPVRFDDTEIPGLLPTIYYQDARKKSSEQIAALFAQTIGQATPPRVEFAILSTEAQFDPLTLKMPGYNKMWPKERASLFTTVKVVFDAGDRPCAELTIVARDSAGNSVGEYSGWFTDSGICDTVPDVPDQLAEKGAFVHSLLMAEQFLFGEVGTYTVSWYLNRALESTTLMKVYLPEDAS